MPNKIKPDHKEFVDEYIENKGNATKAIQKVYEIEDDNYAAVKGSRLLRNDKVMEYLQSKASKVAENIYHLSLNAESENVQLSAGKDILDRAGFKPVEKKDITSGGEPLPTIINIIKPED